MTDAERLDDERHKSARRETGAAISALEKQIRAAMAGAERANAILAQQFRESAAVLAEQLREYKASANEWRATLSDRDRHFVGRSTFDTYADALNRRVDDINSRLTRAEGATAGSKATMAWLVTAVTVAIGAAGLLFGVLR